MKQFCSASLTSLARMAASAPWVAFVPARRQWWWPWWWWSHQGRCGRCQGQGREGRRVVQVVQVGRAVVATACLQLDRVEEVVSR